jgi:hypothetical protein
MMRIKVYVDSEWSGGEPFWWCLELPSGERAHIRDFGHKWTRKDSSRALDVLESWHGIDRRTVRFIVK